MSAPERVPAQISQISATQRRGQLSRLMVDETRVNVYNPLDGGGSWENVTIIGLLDEPGMLIERADGGRRMLPQSFAVDPAVQPEPAGAAPPLASHVYLSTACWHEQHDGDPSMHASCRATCKWCGQGCSCSGHPERDTEDPPPHWVDQARDVARELWNHGHVTPELEQRVAEDPHLFWLRGEEQPPGTWTPPAREEPEDA